MLNPLKSETSKNLGLLLGRLPLGTYFLLAGIDKIEDGVKNFVDSASHKLPAFLPPPIGQTYLYAIPFLEVIVGAFLMFGFFTRTTALIASLMLVSYTVAATGAYGVYGGVPKNIHFNIVYLGISLMLFLAGPGRISVDGAVFKNSF